MRKRIIPILLCFGFVSAWGCGMEGKRMTQSELKYFETRPIDAPFDAVYEAAIEAFFDLGYTMTHSDRGSGVLVGEKRRKKPGAWLLGDIPKGESPENYYDMLQLTILVKNKGKAASKVRIKTAINKEVALDKEAIDEVWVYIERQVLMEEKPDR